MTQNTYIFFRNDQQQAHFTFDPARPDCLDHVEYKYFGRVLNLLEPQIRDSGLVITVTGWTVHELPSYGPNVISCILQDEWAREPKYRDKVGMVFRTCGTSPFNMEAYRHGGATDMVSNFLGQGRAASRDGLSRPRTLLSAVRGKRIAPVYNMPLGYYAREDVAYVPIMERPNDIYFAGSMQHVSLRGLSIPRPKELARRRMEKAISALKTEYPAIRTALRITGGFGESIHTDNASYLQNMMNTKICPVPRGTNLETFRFYEAIRYGCIPVGEAFPGGYFYDGAPLLRLKDWADLGREISALLKDKDRLEDMHKKVLHWWETLCSEQAEADFMCRKIKDGLLC